MQKIVQDHGGDVAVEKTSSSGTVFRVLLPLKSVPDRAADLWLEGKARTGLEPTERPRQT